MAWYRCGGGGIPSSLKSDMNDVFNKKFGTFLQDYPPEDWPGTVNLMGPLPERTVSGSVVAFSDGSDAVQLKSCEVTIAPNLDGVSSVEVVQMGGNFIELYTRDSNAGVSYSINNDGSLHREGTASGNSFNNGNVSDYASCPYKFKAGTYTLSVNGNIDNNTYVQLGIKTASGASVQAQGIAGNGTKTFTVNEDFGAWYYCKLNSGITVDDDVYIWINAGDTSLPYDKKIEPTTHTATLGRTIYGGSVDVVNGECTKAITETKTFDGSSDENWLYSSSYGWFYIDNQFGDAYRNNAEDDFMACNLGTQTKYSSVTTLPDMHFACTSGTNSRFAFKNSQYSTVEDFKAWLSNNNMVVAYTSATFTPFTFTPVPINSRLGDNTMWGDGDLSVTYRRDIDLALAQ